MNRVKIGTQYFCESRIRVKTNICEHNIFLNPYLGWKPTSVSTIFYDLKPRFSCKSTSVNVFHLHQWIPTPIFPLLFNRPSVSLGFNWHTWWSHKLWPWHLHYRMKSSSRKKMCQTQLSLPGFFKAMVCWYCFKTCPSDTLGTQENFPFLPAY